MRQFLLGDSADLLILASEELIGGGEEMVQHEIVKHDDGGRPPQRIEERLYGWSVQRIVAELEEEDVVLCVQGIRCG